MAARTGKSAARALICILKRLSSRVLGESEDWIRLSNECEAVKTSVGQRNRFFAVRKGQEQHTKHTSKASNR